MTEKKLTLLKAKIHIYSCEFHKCITIKTYHKIRTPAVAVGPHNCFPTAGAVLAEPAGLPSPYRTQVRTESRNRRSFAAGAKCPSLGNFASCSVPWARWGSSAVRPSGRWGPASSPWDSAGAPTWTTDQPRPSSRPRNRHEVQLF